MRHTYFPLTCPQFVIPGSCLAVKGRIRTAKRSNTQCFLHCCSSIARKSESPNCSRQRRAEIFLNGKLIPPHAAMHVAKHMNTRLSWYIVLLPSVPTTQQADRLGAPLVKEKVLANSWLLGWTWWLSRGFLSASATNVGHAST